MSGVGDLLLLLGMLFLLLGAIGVVRMPDPYTRIQAGTKAATLGTLAVLAGVAFHRPDWILKLVVVALLVLITNPVGSSTLARALLQSGVVPWGREQERGE